MPSKILITYPIPQATLEGLNSAHQVDCVKSDLDIYGQVSSIIHMYDAVLVMGIPMDQAMIDKGTQLKILSNFGVGYDNVDVAYAKEKGIAVTNLPQSTSAPTANMAIGLMLSLMLKIALHDRLLREGKLPYWHNRSSYGNSPGNKLMGIIGMGRIGKETAKRAQALDMRIAYYKRNRLSTEEEAKYQATYMPMDELLQTADVISLHTPLTDSTFHLIGARELALMKESTFLINTARGSVVDNDALIAALKDKKLAGAGLDVFPDEPQIPNAYLHMDNVVLTPHAGTATTESRHNMFVEAFENIVRFLSGEEQFEARVV